MKFTIILLLVVNMILALPAQSAEVKDPTPTPSEVVLAYFEAYRNMDWALAAQYIHPDSLNEFKTTIVSIVLRTQEGSQQELVEEFGVTSLAALESMPPVDFYVAANRRRWATLGDKQATYLLSSKITILGIKPTAENGTTVSFRTHVDFEGKSSAKTYEYVVLKQGDSWKIDFGHKK